MVAGGSIDCDAITPRPSGHIPRHKQTDCSVVVDEDQLDALRRKGQLIASVADDHFHRRLLDDIPRGIEGVDRVAGVRPRVGRVPDNPEDALGLHPAHTPPGVVLDEVAVELLQALILDDLLGNSLTMGLLAHFVLLGDARKRIHSIWATNTYLCEYSLPRWNYNAVKHLDYKSQNTKTAKLKQFISIL